MTIKRISVISWTVCTGVAALLGLAWGCGSGRGDSETPSATLRLVPAAAELKVGGTVDLRVEDGQGNPVAVSFAVLEAGGGSVGAGGRYQAPAAPGTFHVRATSLQEPVRSVEGAFAVTAYQAALAPAPPSLWTRVDHSATILNDGSVLLAGGPESSALERYLPGAGTFVQAGDLGMRRWAHQASPLRDGRILLTGGIGPSGALATAQTYDTLAGVRTVGPLGLARILHAAEVLADGRVLLAGGLPATGAEVLATTSAEVFDPATGAFTATGAMGSGRTGHTATLLPGGKVLITGGRNSTCLFGCQQVIWASAELFDPATGTFAPTGAMAQARFGHTATPLPDGRVLIAGGTTPDLPDTDVSSAIEIYDPATGAFSPGGTLLRPRSRHTATRLTDGRILFGFGLTHGEGTMASATLEVFDPATAQSTLVVSGLSTRHRHTATRLPSGEVLLAGGSEGGAGIRLAERLR